MCKVFHIHLQYFYVGQTFCITNIGPFSISNHDSDTIQMLGSFTIQIHKNIRIFHENDLSNY